MNNDENQAHPVSTAMPNTLPSRATPAITAFAAKPNKKPRKAISSASVLRAQNEIIKRNKKRRSVKARAKKRVLVAVVRNPNRPLEMKNQLQAVLAMTNVLRKPELLIFSDVVQQFQKLSRGGRKRVIGALTQVYP